MTILIFFPCVNTELLHYRNIHSLHICKYKIDSLFFSSLKFLELYNDYFIPGLLIHKSLKLYWQVDKIKFQSELICRVMGRKLMDGTKLDCSFVEMPQA